MSRHSLHELFCQLPWHELSNVIRHVIGDRFNPQVVEMASLAFARVGCTAGNLLATLGG